MCGMHAYAERGNANTANSLPELSVCTSNVQNEPISEEPSCGNEWGLAFSQPRKPSAISRRSPDHPVPNGVLGSATKATPIRSVPSRRADNASDLHKLFLIISEKFSALGPQPSLPFPSLPFPFPSFETHCTLVGSSEDRHTKAGSLGRRLHGFMNA